MMQGTPGPFRSCPPPHSPGAHLLLRWYEEVWQGLTGRRRSSGDLPRPGIPGWGCWGAPPDLCPGPLALTHCHSPAPPSPSPVGNGEGGQRAASGAGLERQEGLSGGVGMGGLGLCAPSGHFSADGTSGSLTPDPVARSFVVTPLCDLEQQCLK